MRTLTSLAVFLVAVVSGCSGSTNDGLGTVDGGNSTACPATSPPDKSACSLAAGTRCDFGCSAGGPSIATCTGSAWSVAELEIACELPDAGGGDAPPPPADAPFACGSQSCGVTQYCEQPCCGGIAPPCLPMPDGGTCPAGSHQTYCTPNITGTYGMNCQEDPCTPPPPTCVDSPSAAPGCMPLQSGSRNLVCLCA